MVSRVYVEKKPGFDGEARALAAELRDIVGISGLTGVRLVNRYDVEGATDELFAACVPTVFSEPQSDTATFELPEANGAAVFAVEFLPGQFDQRADSASECIQLISQGERPDVRSAVVYYLEGDLTEDDVEAVKRYVINPFKNSGRKAFFSSCMTRLLISLSESPFCPEFEKPSVVVVVMSRAPTFEVMMMTVLRKSTVRPWASVRRPSSRICSRMLNTSGCAFSISSKSTTEYGRWRTALVSWPPSSKPT